MDVITALINTFTICTENINTEKCMLHTSYSENSILPVTDIISSKINTYLFSTQGELGGHNFGGKLVFELKKKFFSHEYEKDSGLKFKGNRYVPKLKDKEFFENVFCYFRESLNGILNFFLQICLILEINA